MSLEILCLSEMFMLMLKVIHLHHFLPHKHYLEQIYQDTSQLPIWKLMKWLCSSYMNWKLKMLFRLKFTQGSTEVTVVLFAQPFCINAMQHKRIPDSPTVAVLIPLVLWSSREKLSSRWKISTKMRSERWGESWACQKRLSPDTLSLASTEIHTSMILQLWQNCTRVIFINPILSHVDFSLSPFCLCLWCLVNQTDSNLSNNSCIF